jgi:5-methylcytosine-specific restriction protein A
MPMSTANPTLPRNLAFQPARLSLKHGSMFITAKLNATAPRQAKKFHGTRCPACALDFGERYGEIGKGFIEAHYLRPIAMCLRKAYR